METDYPDEFVHVEWHYIRALSTSGARDRASYYGGVSASPTVWFDGGNPVLGFSPGTEVTYEAAFTNRQAALAPLDISAVAGFDEASRSGSVTVTVAVAPGETISDISGTHVRCLIYEDDYFLWGRDWHAVGRAMVLDVPLTVSTPGAVQMETANFDLADPDPPAGVAPWGAAQNFRAIAFVQRDSDREVLNAARATSSPSPVTAATWGQIKALYR